MDVTDLRKIFGGAPIEMLTAAQALQKTKNRNIFILTIAVVAFATGAYVSYRLTEHKRWEKKSSNRH